MGLLKLGFVAVYLSDPIISGFTTGAAILVFTSQVKHLLGLSVPRYSGAFAVVKVLSNLLFLCFTGPAVRYIIFYLYTTIFFYVLNSLQETTFYYLSFADVHIYV